MLARAGLERATPLATTGLLLGANLPDVDLLWSPRGLGYYAYHRGVTHSLAGVAVQTAALCAALLLLDRTFLARRGTSRARPIPLLLVCLVAVSSHLLLDAANGYGVRPWLPWDARWVYGDLWVIMDPWIWLLLGGAVFLTGERHPVAAALWIAAAGAVTFLMLRFPDVPVGSRAIWLLGLGLLAALGRAKGRGPDPPARRAIATAALAGVIAYAGLCAGSHALALSRLSALSGVELAGAGIRSLAALPRPADPLRWEGFAETPDTVYHRTLGATTRLDPSRSSFHGFPRGFENPPVRAVLESCVGRVALGFFRFPIASVESVEDSAAVVLRDARFVREGRRPFGMIEVRLRKDGRPELDGVSCP